MFSTPSADDSLARAQGVFEDLHEKLRHGDAHSRQMAIGLALLAEGLLAKIQKMETRLKAIEDAVTRGNP
jgi:hypothetical protein